ncbi:MAG TPA: hypothetical protein VGD84_22745, partial [Pseudonocardiaceae bacterium]
FSIAQWVSQSNGNNDRRHSAILHSLTPAAGGTAVAPLVSGALNPQYPITREVYNVVLRSSIVNGGAGTGFDQRLTNLLVGPNSALCTDGFTIASFGFATLDTAPLGHNCGAVADNLRAFAAL